MKLTFEFHFTKEDGFTEKDFLQIISRDLSQLGYITVTNAAIKVQNSRTISPFIEG